MKKILFLFFMITIILPFSGCSETKEDKSKNDLPLHEFIIGKWRSDRENSDIYGTYHEDYFIKFITKNRLLYCNNQPIEPFCAFLNYSEIDEGKFSVENERMNSGEWKIVREGDDLNICIWSDANCMLFTRDTSKFNFSLEVLGRMK